MTSQLEQDLMTAFGEHTGGAVDTDALAAAATSRGRRLRATTYAVRGAAAAVAVAVVAAGVAGATGADRTGIGQQAQPSQSASPGWTADPPPGGWAVPRPPVLDVPADPSKVGTDPALLHFTVDEWSERTPFTTWRSVDGVETITFARDPALYTVSMAKSAALLDDALQRENRDPSGHLPATEETADGVQVFTTGPMRGFFYQRWQPAPGVWAQTFGQRGSPADAEQIKARVRLDVTLRCTAPIQLTGVPSGAALLGCETTLAGRDLPGRLMFATLWVGENSVDRAEIFVRQRGPGSASPSPAMTIAGRPARVFTDDRFRPSVEFPDVNGVTINIAGTGSYGPPAVLTVAEHVTVGATPLDPGTWSPPLAK